MTYTLATTSYSTNVFDYICRFEGILSNLRWNIVEPLDSAVIVDFGSNEYRRMDDTIRQALNNTYLEDTINQEIPVLQMTVPIKKIIVTIATYRTEAAFKQGTSKLEDIAFSVPKNWSNGMNYWQLLSGIESYVNWGKQQYGPLFVGRAQIVAGFSVAKIENGIPHIEYSTSFGMPQLR